MPRKHDKEATPSAAQRQPKGTVAGTPRFSLTADDLDALEHLAGKWTLNKARTVGRALREAAGREGWTPPAKP